MLRSARRRSAPARLAQFKSALLRFAIASLHSLRSTQKRAASLRSILTSQSGLRAVQQIVESEMWSSDVIFYLRICRNRSVSCKLKHSNFSAGISHRFADGLAALTIGMIAQQGQRIGLDPGAVLP